MLKNSSSNVASMNGDTTSSLILDLKLLKFEEDIEMAFHMYESTVVGKLSIGMFFNLLQ